MSDSRFPYDRDEFIASLPQSMRDQMVTYRAKREQKRQALIDDMNSRRQENIDWHREDILRSRSQIELLPTWAVRILSARKLESIARQRVDAMIAARLQSYDKATRQHENDTLQMYEMSLQSGHRPKPRTRSAPTRDHGRDRERER